MVTNANIASEIATLRKLNGDMCTTPSFVPTLFVAKTSLRSDLCCRWVVAISFVPVDWLGEALRVSRLNHSSFNVSFTLLGACEGCRGGEAVKLASSVGGNSAG